MLDSRLSGPRFAPSKARIAATFTCRSELDGLRCRLIVRKRMGDVRQLLSLLDATRRQ